MTTVYQGHQSSSRMFVGVTVVVAFHLIVIVAFKSGLIREFAPVFKPPMEAVIIPVPMEELPPPPPPAVNLSQQLPDPVITYIPPEIALEQLPAESPVTVFEAGPVARESAAATGEGPQVTEFQVDSRYPLTKPYYPPPEVRLGHEGLVTLMIYVLPNGRVGEAKVATSSGYRRLDDSAMREALKSWRFKPRMEGGRTVGSWGSFKVRFTLDE
jgi:protein TonB